MKIAPSFFYMLHALTGRNFIKFKNKIVQNQSLTKLIQNNPKPFNCLIGESENCLIV